MRTPYELLKTQALRYLPDAWLQRLKRAHYVRMLRSLDESSEPDLQVVRRIVAPGDTVIDVGANVGVYTKVLSEAVGTAGLVISVEPVPQTFRILRHAVEALALGNVRTVNAAVSDAEGVLRMIVPDYDMGGSNFYQARIVSGDGEGERSARDALEVRATTLDRIADELDAIAFIKCDVEGHEAACLDGAIRVLADRRPAWLIEISGDPDEPGGAAAGVLDRMAAVGYTPWWFDGRALRRRRVGDASVNYFFLTDRHAAELAARVPGLVDPRAGVGP